jgi:hypothetical protein
MQVTYFHTHVEVTYFHSHVEVTYFHSHVEENVYVFILQDVQFRTEKSQVIELESVKIVACDGTKNEKKKK